MTEQMTDQRAFQGWCYMCPEAVRLARAALDIGATADELIPIFEKHTKLPSLRDVARMAIQYMVDNPNAGAVKWMDSGTWEWAANDYAPPMISTSGFCDPNHRHFFSESISIPPRGFISTYVFSDGPKDEAIFHFDNRCDMDVDEFIQEERQHCGDRDESAIINSYPWALLHELEWGMEWKTRSLTLITHHTGSLNGALEDAREARFEFGQTPRSPRD